MSLYRSFAGGPTSCVRCSEVIYPHWRDFAAHSAAHGRRDQLTARAARVKAMREARNTQAYPQDVHTQTLPIAQVVHTESTGASSGLVFQDENRGVSEAAPGRTPEPPLSTSIDRSTHMENNAAQHDLDGVA